MERKAYAKINLTLDITGVREDGFHTLDTVMHSISLYDTVTLTPSKEPGVRVYCDKSYLPVDAKNTAYRAAALFLETYGLTEKGVDLDLKKVIPSRAGMGGGSADAAAVLHGLNDLFGVGASLDDLMALGAQIGADVPFCVHGGACRCQGIGEILEPVTPLPDCFLVLCKPPAGMSTPRAFAMIDSCPPARTQNTPRMLRALETGDLRQIGKCLGNRFDEAIKLMQVRQIEKTMLSAGAAGAMMTGSGSAVFGLFQTEPSARNCMELLREKGEVFLTRPLGESPVKKT